MLFLEYFSCEFFNVYVCSACKYAFVCMYGYPRVGWCSLRSEKGVGYPVTEVISCHVCTWS